MWHHFLGGLSPLCLVQHAHQDFVLAQQACHIASPFVVQTVTPEHTLMLLHCWHSMQDWSATLHCKFEPAAFALIRVA